MDWGEVRGKYPDDIVPDFNSSILLLNEQLKPLAKLLYKLLAIGLGLEDEDFFVKKSQHWDYPTKFSGQSSNCSLSRNLKRH
jgi:isopenicillin N synthase-like dioxygenase